MTKELKKPQIIVHTHFLGSVTFYALHLYGQVHWEAHENYQKRSARNKCSVKSGAEIINFTVPLAKGKHEQQNIKEVKISYDMDWIKELKHLLRTAYQAAPYYDFYYQDVMDIIEAKHQYLWTLNKVLHEFIIRKIAIDNPSLETTHWIKEYPNDWYDFRFKKEIDAKDYSYFQVPDGTLQFYKGLSILDLLFCAGPESKLHLNNIKLRL